VKKLIAEAAVDARPLTDEALAGHRETADVSSPKTEKALPRR